MLIFLSIAAAVLGSIAQMLLFSQERMPAVWVKTILKNGLFVSLTTLALHKYVLGFAHFLDTDSYEAVDFILFFLLSLAVAFLFLAVHGIVHHYLTFASVRPEKKKTGLKVFCCILVFLGCIAVLATNWSKTEYGDLPADQVLITYLSPTTGSDMVDYTQVLEGPIFLSIFLTSVFGLFAFSDLKITYKNGQTAVTILSDVSRRVLSLVLAILIFLGGVGYGVVRYHLVGLYNAYFARSTFIDNHFVDPRKTNLEFPEKKRNLIHIYLESMENSYMSKELGGFMDKNLIPELTQIAREGYSFSHLPDNFGGPQSAVGTTWSVASMVNMSTGLPMKAPTENNAYGTPGNFLPGAYTLGDILEEQGYEQTLMFGADADFGGLTYYFQTHGSFKIMDYKYAKEHNMIPDDYFVWWGYEDDKLFPFAMAELTRLSQTGKPFNFIMETADTHRPNGYLSKNAPTPYPNQYANVLSYSSAEVAKFVRWIQAQPFYENTTIVITGDHLSMETNFFQFYDFDPDYRRSQYNVILNPAPGTASDSPAILYNRDYANFDFFPTIMTSLGVKYDGHRLGIGTDLFSGEKTLFEEYGFEKANRELEKKSVFYNKHILN